MARVVGGSTEGAQHRPGVVISVFSRSCRNAAVVPQNPPGLLLLPPEAGSEVHLSIGVFSLFVKALCKRTVICNWFWIAAQPHSDNACHLGGS